MLKQDLDVKARKISIVHVHSTTGSTVHSYSTFDYEGHYDVLCCWLRH